MNKIGLIFAMHEELEESFKYFEEKNKFNVFDLLFYEGYINGVYVVMVECGIGKVNAARTTQILIDNLKVDYIINVGVAGGVSSDLSVGDLVIAIGLVQHDFDITSFGHEKGYITGVGKVIDSDTYLSELFYEKALDMNLDVGVFKGIIASGDIFCTDVNMSKKINQKFGALCVEMEGASIAQVCYLCHIPFLVIRAISDVVNDKNNVDFDLFLKSSSSMVSNVLVRVISSINVD